MKKNFIFQSDIFEHVDQNFHNEKVVESESNFYMHYESEDVDFILASELIHKANLIGETDRRNISSLSHDSSDENQIYDRGKKNC